MKLLALAVALAALASFAFADVGPGPTDIPSITIHATIDGAPVPDDTSVKLHCYIVDEEFMGPGASYTCTAGTCEGGMYKLNPCAKNGNATFEFSHPSFSRNYTTSPQVHLVGGYDYEFNVTIFSSSNGTASIVGKSWPQQPPCFSVFILLAALAAVPLLVAVKR